VSLRALDTDILSLYQRGHPVVCQHVAAHPPVDLAITVISIEEQLTGWYALLRTTTRRDHLAIAYQSLAQRAFPSWQGSLFLPIQKPPSCVLSNSLA